MKLHKQNKKVSLVMDEKQFQTILVAVTESSNIHVRKVGLELVNALRELADREEKKK